METAMNKQKTRIFPLWKELEIGGVSKSDLLAQMEAAGIGVWDYAKDIMSKAAFTTSATKRKLRLARAKIGDLGFTSNPTTAEIWERIRSFGHALCPAEAGPHLRLAFADQLPGDYF